MANLQSFRTAFHGFNRDDVVQYIETVNNQHDAALAAQREENQRLRKELEREREDAQTARERADRLKAEKTELESQQGALNARLEEAARSEEIAQALREEKQALQEELQTLREENCALREDLSAKDAALEAVQAPRNEPPRQDWTGEELAAYRRAEQAERLAKARAARSFDQINALVADLAARLDEAIDQTAQAETKVNADLEQLRTAAAGSKRLLADTAATLRAMRPSDEEE